MPSDLKYFRDKTRGKVMIMGRKTFESMKKPLHGRVNIVVTRDKNHKAEGCIIVNTIKEALKEAIKDVKAENEEVMVIGGAQIYQEFLPMANRIYLTIIEENFDGDAYFPKCSNEWKEISREEHKADKNNPYDYAFTVLEKDAPIHKVKNIS